MTLIAVGKPLSSRPRRPAARSRREAVIAEGDSVLLLIDEHERMRRLAGIHGHRHGPLMLASSTVDAIAALESSHVDIVISHHSMPRGTVINLLAYVEARNLPVRFFLTSADAPGSVWEIAQGREARAVSKHDQPELL